MAEQELEKFAKEIKLHIDEKSAETQRHFDVVAENLMSEIQTVAEQVVQNSEDITEIKQDMQGVKEDVQGVKDTLEIMKTDLEFIKNELKQKVNRDEFVALEKRLNILEIRFNQGR